ncbi:MAG: hypothetical protein AB9836_05975 [Aminipila sp.]
MYTAQEIFANSISILDELSDNGTVNPSDVEDYANRAPYLLDMWQKKMAKSGDLYYISEYVNADDNNLNKWIKYDIPNNMKSIKEIMFIDGDLQISTVEYKQFGRTDIYIRFAKTGTARMLYVPIPAKINSLTQTLEVDDITAQSGSYYLAEHFAIADQNDELAKKCKDEFKALLLDSATTALGAVTEIKDAYGGWYE